MRFSQTMGSWLTSIDAGTIVLDAALRALRAGISRFKSFHKGSGFEAVRTLQLGKSVREQVEKAGGCFWREVRRMQMNPCWYRHMPLESLGVAFHEKLQLFTGLCPPA